MPETIHPTGDDHLAIVDTLHRFAAGQDYRDDALLRSAFTDDAMLDFTQPAARLGVDLPRLDGAQAITETVMAATAPLTTTHSVTNARITDYSGQTATLVALVEAQHLPADDHTRCLLLKNKFTASVVRCGHQWAIRTLVIENLWKRGEGSVLFPQRS